MSGCDRISGLPDSLLTHILSLLPTMDSVKTSVLSTRWKNLWLNVPALDLACSDFPYNDDEDPLLSFIDRFLEFDPESRLPKLKVKCRGLDTEGLSARIAKAINRGIQNLDYESPTYYLDDDMHLYPCIDYMPRDLYRSKTLVSVKLTFSALEVPPGPGSIYMPCLKFMHLVEVNWHSNADLEKLLSGCPVLEELTLLRNANSNFHGPDDEFMRVRSRSLKRFYVARRKRYFKASRVKCMLEIDAPGLEYLSLKVNGVVVKDLSSLVTIDFDIKFFSPSFNPHDLSKRNEIRDFLTGVSSVKDMIVSQNTMKVLGLYSEAGGLIPKFNNLSRLQFVLPRHLSEFLPDFLEIFPNLKHLILKVDYLEMMMGEFELLKVPPCLLTTLECVEIRGILEWGEKKMKIASYFLENAQVLKKLVVGLENYELYLSHSEIYKEINKVTKRSPSCSVVLECDMC